MTDSEGNDFKCKRHGGDRNLSEDEYCSVKEIAIVNRHDGKEKPGVYRVNVSRPGPLGNPFIAGEHGTRKQVIALYEEHFKKLVYTPCALSEAFVTLVEYMMTECYMELECWCAPKACHAEIIREAVFEDDWLWK
jgi:hypothetical protein